jgi:hypothetical protein
VGHSLPQILGLLTVAQIANTAGFWQGLLAGRAVRMTW